MNNRLIEIIAYKTNGKQKQFAELMGWSPQYLAKLIKGGNFGLQPVLSILRTLPEISARWFLFGTGQMFEEGGIFELQRQAMSQIQSLLNIEKFIPVMSANEIKEIKEALEQHRTPTFGLNEISVWQELLEKRNQEIETRFKDAMQKAL